jgi:hypothetical protein
LQLFAESSCNPKNLLYNYKHGRRNEAPPKRKRLKTMSQLQEIEVSIYRQGTRVALCPLQLQPDPSGEQELLEYNQEDVSQAISASITAEIGMIQEVTVQNPFEDGEVWEVLFTDGERQTYVIEYE